MCGTAYNYVFNCRRNNLAFADNRPSRHIDVILVVNSGNSMNNMVRVAVVDDHPIFRDGVVWTLDNSKKIKVIGQGTCSRDAIRIADSKRPPDVMLLDVTMPGCGLKAADTIHRSHPRVKTVMLTVSESEEHLSEALNAGVSGYILKGINGPTMVQAVCDVHKGGSYVSPELAARALTRLNAARAKPQPRCSIDQLTARETEIVTQVSRGLTNKEVARGLKLSEKTVKHYMTSIMQKLHARNRVEAVLIWAKAT